MTGQEDPQQRLHDLQDRLVEVMESKLDCEDVTAADLAVIRQLLKDNGIMISARARQPLQLLGEKAAEHPFPVGGDGTATGSD